MAVPWVHWGWDGRAVGALGVRWPVGALGVGWPYRGFTGVSTNYVHESVEYLIYLSFTDQVKIKLHLKQTHSKRK